VNEHDAATALTSSDDRFWAHSRRKPGGAELGAASDTAKLKRPTERYGAKAMVES